jgi:hypothetical protein
MITLVYVVQARDDVAPEAAESARMERCAG